MRRFLALWLIVCACLFAAHVSFAQLTLTGAGKKAAAAPSYTGPGDIVSGAKLWYSCSFGYNAADTADACDVCLPLDATCAHITLTNGVAVVPGSLSTCSLVTICTVKTMFDKGSLGINLTNATIATRPTFRPAVASNGCPTTSNPCVLFTAAASQLLTATSVTIAQPMTASMVYNKTVSGAASFANFSAALFISSNSDNIILIFGATLVGSTIANNTFHAGQLVINSTSSEIYVDGASNVTGDAGTGAPSGSTLQLGTDSFSFFGGVIGEFGIWPSAFNGAQEGNMNTNQKTTRWGFLRMEESDWRWLVGDNDNRAEWRQAM